MSFVAKNTFLERCLDYCMLAINHVPRLSVWEYCEESVYLARVSITLCVRTSDKSIAHRIQLSRNNVTHDSAPPSSLNIGHVHFLVCLNMYILTQSARMRNISSSPITTSVNNIIARSLALHQMICSIYDGGRGRRFTST